MSAISHIAGKIAANMSGKHFQSNFLQLSSLAKSPLFNYLPDKENFPNFCAWLRALCFRLWFQVTSSRSRTQLCYSQFTNLKSQKQICFPFVFEKKKLLIVWDGMGKKSLRQHWVRIIVIISCFRAKKSCSMKSFSHSVGIRQRKTWNFSFYWFLVNKYFIFNWIFNNFKLSVSLVALSSANPKGPCPKCTNDPIFVCAKSGPNFKWFVNSCHLLGWNCYQSPEYRKVDNQFCQDNIGDPTMDNSF